MPRTPASPALEQAAAAPQPALPGVPDQVVTQDQLPQQAQVVTLDPSSYVQNNFSNSLYGAWDEQFYPDGVSGWMTKIDVQPGGGMAIDSSAVAGSIWFLPKSCGRTGPKARSRRRPSASVPDRSV